MKDHFFSASFATVIEWEANQVDWRESFIADPEREIEVLPGWET
jgi:hypothetical protein